MFYLSMTFVAVATLFASIIAIGMMIWEDEITDAFINLINRK